MDWALIYGTLIRNTGWTFKQCGKQPADRVFEFLGHLADYPTSDAILRSRYKIKPTVRQVAKQGKSVAAEISSFLGPAQAMPESVRALIEWADNPESWKKKK
jgi:hypothetical protein